MELTIGALEEWEAAARKLLDFAGGRRVFAFYGEIGAGKTTFIQAICKCLGVEDDVSSPTFALVNEYWSNTVSEPVYHIDLYRLHHLQEALEIGIEEYIDGNTYCFVEWPELIDALLPDEVVKVKISTLANSHRKLLFL